MTYKIAGLDPTPYAPLFSASDTELRKAGADRLISTSDTGFPCRISLTDAVAGEELLLLHYVHHDVASPFRGGYAIYVRKDAAASASFTDEMPPIFASRTLGLRGYNADGYLTDARLALPGEADHVARALFDNPDVAYIHAHNASYGCFLAQIDRDGEGE